MDMYQLKFTRLQEELLRFLFINAGLSFNAREISKRLKVSPTAVAKSLKALEKEGFIRVSKGSNRLSIELNRDNQRVFCLKRVENLKLVYESGLVDLLSESLPGATIILFGSYSFGEDTSKSDIDLAIIGSKVKEIDLSRFEKLLERKISLQFYGYLASIDKNLRENILNGIVIKGGVQL